MILRQELRVWVISFFFVLLSLFMMHRIFFFSEGAIERSSSYLLYPFLKAQKIITDPIHNYLSNRKKHHDIIQKINILEHENELLYSKLIENESIRDFQEQTQEIRDFAQRYHYSHKKLAKILLRSFDDVGHFCWVGAGSKHGIVQNMIAIYKNNIVGRVVQVNPLYSKIIFITDKRCKIAVACSKTKSAGIYHGNDSFFPTLEFIPHYKKLVEEDLVLSTGQGLVFPQGFSVGKIKSFAVDGATYKAIIQPLIDFEQLDYLYLINL